MNRWPDQQRAPSIPRALNRSDGSDNSKRFPLTLLAGVAGALLFSFIALGFALRSDTLLGHALGIAQVPVSSLPRAQSIVVSGASPSFSPQATVVRPGGSVTFVNRLDHSLIIRTASRSAASFTLQVGTHGQATVLLRKAGLYHYYDAATARTTHVVANNDVIVSGDGGSSPPRQGWIIVLGRLPGLRQYVMVPKMQDLFAPKALVATVGSTILVSNHDTDAHNFVVDPASPAGGAFIINGSDDEPPDGWHSVLVVQRPGLYHFYCAMHTRQAGTAHGWRVVVPRWKASGYRDHNPMEGWIVVLPAYTVAGGRQ